MSHERAKELVELFKDFTGTYLLAEVEEALIIREEITPLLIGILEEVAADPVEYVELDRFGHEYAVALLAHFREPAAHLPIIRAFSLPPETLDLIWGDMITETLPALLCRTACGDYDAIKGLVLNQDAEQFVRTAAMESLLLAVASGDLPRDEAIAFYANLFDESLARPDENFWPGLVNNLLDLYADELIGEIRDLYAKGRVKEWDISTAEIDEILADGLDATLAKLPQKLARRVPEDIHSYISWFACFKENDQLPKSHAPSPLKALKKLKTKARNKRKQGKAAKRKNRK
jgi:hypothetical protein